MDCPVCKNSAMIVLELDEVEVDYCTECEGIWLDEGELELLLGDEARAKEVIQSFQTAESEMSDLPAENGQSPRRRHGRPTGADRPLRP